MIKELVEYIVKQLASNPDKVDVSVMRDGNKHVLKITVDDCDRGRLIGKNGRTIKALRMLVDVITPNGKKVLVNIVE